MILRNFDDRRSVHDNALGDVLDPATGEILAGLRPVRFGPLRLGGRGPFADSLAMMRRTAGRAVLRLATRGNTVIGVVATKIGRASCRERVEISGGAVCLR